MYLVVRIDVRVVLSPGLLACVYCDDVYTCVYVSGCVCVYVKLNTSDTTYSANQITASLMALLAKALFIIHGSSK